MIGNSGRVYSVGTTPERIKGSVTILEGDIQGVDSRPPQSVLFETEGSTSRDESRARVP